MHAASDTLKEWLYEWNKYHPDKPLYAIKADIHHYFQSIDHAVLKTEIRKVIKDAGVLALLDRIIDHKRCGSFWRSIRTNCRTQTNWTGTAPQAT